MLFHVTVILILVAIGVTCFWAVDKFVQDRRLANILKATVVVLCLASILQQLPPMLWIELFQAAT